MIMMKHGKLYIRIPAIRKIIDPAVFPHMALMMWITEWTWVDVVISSLQRWRCEETENEDTGECT